MVKDSMLYSLPELAASIGIITRRVSIQVNFVVPLSRLRSSQVANKASKSRKVPGAQMPLILAQ